MLFPDPRQLRSCVKQDWTSPTVVKHGALSAVASHNPLGRMGCSVRAVLLSFLPSQLCWPRSFPRYFQWYPTLYSKFITFNYLQNDSLHVLKLITDQNGTPGPLTSTVRGETSRTPNLDFLESKVLRIPSSTQIKSRNLKSRKTAKRHFSDTELRTPNSTQNWTGSETPQTHRNTSRYQSKNTSKLRIITGHTDVSNIS